jgi:hypothetical protein
VNTSDFYEDKPGEMSFIPEFKPEKVGNCETGTNGNLNSIHNKDNDDFEYIIQSGVVPDNLDDKEVKEKITKAACNIGYKDVCKHERPNYSFQKHPNERELAAKLQQADMNRKPLEHPKLDRTNTLDKITLDWFSSDYEEKRTECFFKKEEAKREAQRKREYEAAKALPMCGMVVFKVNVGQLPKDEAEKYIDKYKETIKHVIDRIPAKYETLFIPTRTEETAVQVVKV